MVPQDAHQTEQSARSGGTLDVDHHLLLSGELVQATVGGFDKAIRAVLNGSPREIVVDLTEVGRIDEAGLTALLKAHLRSRQRGLPIRFVPSDHEAVKQLLTVTGTGDSPG